VPGGLTVTLEPLRAPGFQEYVEAPLTVSVVEPPVHIVAGPETLSVGVVFTLTVTVFGALVQPPVVPVTV